MSDFSFPILLSSADCFYLSSSTLQLKKSMMIQMQGIPKAVLC
jgi:hypothetical protein